MTEVSDDLIDPTDQGEHRPNRVAPWIAMAIAITMVGLFVVLIGADPGGGKDAQSPLLGRPAPEATGTLLDGGNFDLSQRKGSWVVLNFFRADCIPCIQEHPDLVEFTEQQAALGIDGAEFYSIVVDDSREDVEKFFADNGGDWPVVLDHRLIDVAFGVALVPETWIIDPSGIVEARIISRVSTERLNIAMQQLREVYTG
ncbi:MAG: cytochrome c biogenesis protein CcmG/thiol:disulfide interchange protein DsbE [Candidatus Azotimanducaceae bacterium]|jgi:cytochrome c biogenesis protein CcmG/thiol:disulfide interchange protein DsbE|tara:strand:- start:265 stop:864 length:600 start_codon:yes stop_codon:yes gene_type:complete